MTQEEYKWIYMTIYQHWDSGKVPFNKYIEHLEANPSTGLPKLILRDAQIFFHWMEKPTGDKETKNFNILKSEEWDYISIEKTTKFSGL